ncbi:MAG TPA: hypothetical protein PLK08_04520 [Phycisphaerae bacterium]|nr:hypothetical protein [Phycisphaerae bacterium]
MDKDKKPWDDIERCKRFVGAPDEVRIGDATKKTHSPKPSLKKTKKGEEGMMRATAVDKSGQVHVFSLACDDPADAFADLMQWWAKLTKGKPQETLESVKFEPDTVNLPFLGEASLSNLFLSAAATKDFE